MMKLLKFYADWCVPCRRLQEVLEQVNTDIPIESIDVSTASEELLAKYEVRNIPLLILVKQNQDGSEEIVWRHVGFINKEIIENKLNV